MTRREIEHAIAQIKRPEDVVNHCLSAREYRVGIDNVTDNVQLALKEEMKEIKRKTKRYRNKKDER